MKKSNDQLVAGIDLGGTHAQIGIVNVAGRIVARIALKTQAHEGSDAVIARVCDGVRQACEQAGCAVSDLAGLGIGVPSPIDSTSRIALHAVNLEWKDLPVADLIEASLGGRPVILENDVNTAVWGEYVLGAARGFDNVLGLWIGTGIGGGLVLGGKLHRGTFGTAGEIGMGTVYLKDSGAAMRFEDFAARSAIEERIARAIRGGRASSPVGPVQEGGGSASIEEIAQGFADGDAAVREIVESAADLTGLLVANAATLLSLDAVVFGGGLVEALGPSYLALVRQRFDEVVFPEALRACTLVETSLRENAGLLGAASMAQAALCLDRGA